MSLLRSYWWLAACMMLVVFLAVALIPSSFREYYVADKTLAGFEWKQPDSNLIPSTAEGDLIRYGKELIKNTGKYIGPHGKVQPLSNGMNCQHCHLEAGTKFLGNNYSAVYSTYPKFRARSGGLETIYKRINDCIERSLNGTKLDSNSREIKAIYAYMKWLGEHVPSKTKPLGAGIAELGFLDRAADPAVGKKIYAQKCVRCHGANGEGTKTADKLTYTYPPLWGEKSYNTGAGLYRISRLAGFLLYNMPYDISTEVSPLTDEEAWDLAAFINSQPRPHKKFAMDWPDIKTKPFDHPFGPYADTFNEQQHKYGPYMVVRK